MYVPFLGPCVCGYPCDIQVNQAAKAMTSWDALIDLLESMEQFVSRLRIYTEILSLPSAMVEIMVNIMVELISTLGLVTEKLKQHRPSESVLADVLPYSARRSQFYKELYRGQGHQGSPAKA